MVYPVIKAGTNNHSNLLNLSADDHLQYHCFSEDTEILTCVGWKTHNEIAKGTEVFSFNLDNGNIERDLIEEVFRYIDYDEMFSIKNRNIDLLITADHGIVYKHRRKSKDCLIESPKWLSGTADDVSKINRISIPVASQIQKTPKSDVLLQSYYELQGMFIADGSKVNSTICFWQNSGKKAEHIKQLLDILGLKYTVNINSRAGRSFIDKFGNTYISNNDYLCIYVLGESYKNSTFAFTKNLNKFKEINNLYFDSLLKGLVDGDGHWYNDTSCVYYSKEQKTLDILQELCIRHGYRAGIKYNGHNIWKLNICLNNQLIIQNKHFNKVGYSGIAWCAKVKNRTLIVRRNGLCAILHNTDARGDARYYTQTQIDNRIIDDLSDVVIASPANNEVLTYNSTSGNWENAPSPGSSATVWGNITGTLSDQTDLQAALDLKADQSSLDTHTNDATIHFTEASISITESQISDLQSYLLNVVEDLTPQLGGDLHTNTFAIHFEDSLGGMQGGINASDAFVFDPTLSGLGIFHQHVDADFDPVDGGMIFTAGETKLYGSIANVQTLAGSGSRQVYCNADGDLYPVVPPPPGFSVSDTDNGDYALPTLATWVEMTGLQISVPSDVAVGVPLQIFTNIHVVELSGNRSGEMAFNYSINAAVPAGAGIIKPVVRGFDGLIPISITTTTHGGLTAGDLIRIWVQRASQSHAQFDLNANASTGALHELTVSTQSADIEHKLSSLSDVQLGGSPLIDDLFLQYNSITGLWEATTIAAENVFGSYFQNVEDATVSTTLSTTFISKLSMTTPVLPIGKYRIGVSYGWNHNSVSSDFEARLMEDSIQKGEIHKYEPSDSSGNFSSTGSSQRYHSTRVFYSTYGTPSTHTFDIEFRTDDALDESSIFGSIIEIWRVS